MVDDEAMRRSEDITGQRFGKLTAQEKTDKKRSGSYLWQCRCDCGKQILATSCQLRSGAVKSCGCSRKGHGVKDLSGQRFGSLTAVERLEEKSGSCYLWRCVCDCGNEVTLRSNVLLSGNTTSCGCARQKEMRSRAKDIAGRRFGRLTALHPLEERRCGSVLWQCRCDCGKETAYSYLELMYGGYKSCGCEHHASQPLPLHYVDGTCVEMLEKRKLRSDNSSGCTGVVWTKHGWRAQIHFKGRSYYLGTFAKKEDAVAARKQAEEERFDAFLAWYHASFPEKTEKHAENIDSI